MLARVLAVIVCVCVCRLNEGSRKQHNVIAQGL